MTRKSKIDEREIAYLIEGGLTRESARSVVAKRNREEQAAVREAEAAIEVALGQLGCSIAQVRINALLQAVQSATGYSRYGAADIITRVFESMSSNTVQGSGEHKTHFKANVGAASRALSGASVALASGSSAWRSQAGQSVTDLVEAAYYLGRAEVHRSLMEEAEPKVDKRFEELFLSRREWGPNFLEWLKGRP